MVFGKKKKEELKRVGFDQDEGGEEYEEEGEEEGEEPEEIPEPPRKKAAQKETNVSTFFDNLEASFNRLAVEINYSINQLALFRKQHRI